MDHHEGYEAHEALDLWITTKDAKHTKISLGDHHEGYEAHEALDLWITTKHAKNTKWWTWDR